VPRNTETTTAKTCGYGVTLCNGVCSLLVTKAVSGNSALAAFSHKYMGKVGASSAVESPKLHSPGAAPGHLAISILWGRMSIAARLPCKQTVTGASPVASTIFRSNQWSGTGIQLGVRVCASYWIL